MKNYFKKFSIMFIMTLLLAAGSCVSALADDTSQSVTINKTTLNFSKVIYVSTAGNDSIGDGSKEKPFLTFDKAYEDASDNSAIVLGDGTFNAIKYAQDYINSSKSISIIGNGEKTKLVFPPSPDSHYYPIGTIKFYRLTITFSGSSFAGICADGVSPATAFIYFYNVNFIDNGGERPIAGGDWTSPGAPSRFNVYSYNSSFQVKSSELEANFTLVNSSINQSSFTSNSYYKITSNESPLYEVTYDDNYKITNKTWNSLGDGKNPDGTQANIGVYGGEFAWGEWNREEESITLDNSSMNLTIGQIENLVATTTPAGATVNWTSSDPSIATVDSTGKVTGIKEGQAVITATTADGLTATCVLTVTPKTAEPTNPNPDTTDSENIVNIAHAKGDNTNNAGGDVTIIFHGSADTTLSVVKTADVKDVWVGDNFTYTIVVTNTGTKTAKAVVVNDPAPNHIDFLVNGVTSTQGKIDPSSTSKNIIVNVGDIAPGATVTIKIPATVVL